MAYHYPFHHMNQQLIGCLPLLHVPRFRLIDQSRKYIMVPHAACGA